jgi:hypothetical protein
VMQDITTLDWNDCGEIRPEQLKGMLTVMATFIQETCRDIQNMLQISTDRLGIMQVHNTKLVKSNDTERDYSKKLKAWGLLMHTELEDKNKICDRWDEVLGDTYEPIPAENPTHPPAPP